MKDNESLRSWQTPNWVKCLVYTTMRPQPHHLCSLNPLGFHRNWQALRGSRKCSVTKKNSSSLVWDLECAFGVVTWILPSRRIMVLYFTFMSVIHFDISFVKGVPWMSRLFWVWISSSFNTIYWTFFSSCSWFCSIVEDQLIIFGWVYFCALHFVPLISLFW